MCIKGFALPLSLVILSVIPYIVICAGLVLDADCQGVVFLVVIIRVNILLNQSLKPLTAYMTKEKVFGSAYPSLWPPHAKS